MPEKRPRPAYVWYPQKTFVAQNVSDYYFLIGAKATPILH